MSAEDAGLTVGGQGPLPPSQMISDRAGQESLVAAVTPAISPLAFALRTLDTLDIAPDQGVRSAVGEQDVAETPAPSGPGAERREQILDGAAKLFAERGYHGASLRDISRSVGISHPGMLHHFTSKPALLDAVIDRLEAHAQGLLDSAEQLSTSPAHLEAALGGPWHPARHPMSLLATLSAEVVDPEHPGRYRIARLRLVHEHVLEMVLGAYADRGLLTPETDTALVARSLVSLLLSLAVRERSVRTLQTGSAADPVSDVRAVVRHYLVA